MATSSEQPKLPPPASESNNKSKPRRLPPYCPLRQGANSIRLVKIRPARCDTEIIVCDVAEVSLEESPQYEALSYSPGDRSVRKIIIVNGLKGPVDGNLFDALRYLRCRREIRPVWIYGLCINPADNMERNMQLLTYCRVFSKASLVVVWLGQSYAQYQAEASRVHVSPLSCVPHFLPHIGVQKL